MPPSRKRSLKAVCCFLLLCCPLLSAQSSEEFLSDARRNYRAGSLDEAIRIYKSILERDKSSAPAHSGLVLALLKKDDVSEAYETARRALSAVPESAAVHAALGDVFFRKGQFADSEAEYKKALKFDGKLARGWWGLGRVATCVSMYKSAK